MRITRRRVLGMGGGLLAALSLPRTIARAEAVTDISMTGKADGSRVWFDPIGIHLQVGQAVRWTNEDAGNSHTATAYHPDNFDRPRRIPLDAEPWDSGYLLPGDSYSTTFTMPGVFDYYCLPHEMAGMVGRIVVGTPAPDRVTASGSDDGLPEAALAAFPSVEEIMRKGMVRRG